MEHTDLTHGNTIANEVEIDLDVLGALVLDGVRGHVDCADIVTEHNRSRRRRSMKLMEELPDLAGFSDYISNSTVLSLSARAGDRVLPLGGPRDEVVAEVDTEAGRRSASVGTAGPVGVGVGDHGGRRRCIELESMSECALDVAQDTLDGMMFIYTFDIGI